MLHACLLGEQINEGIEGRRRWVKSLVGGRLNLRPACTSTNLRATALTYAQDHGQDMAGSGPAATARRTRIAVQRQDGH